MLFSFGLTNIDPTFTTKPNPYKQRMIDMTSDTYQTIRRITLIALLAVFGCILFGVVLYLKFCDCTNVSITSDQEEDDQSKVKEDTGTTSSSLSDIDEEDDFESSSDDDQYDYDVENQNDSTNNNTDNDNNSSFRRRESGGIMPLTNREEFQQH